MSPINAFLLQHGFTLARNPCISPDFCLDWPSLRQQLGGGSKIRLWQKSAFQTAEGSWQLGEDERTGDCFWRLHSDHARARDALEDVQASGASVFNFPATWENLLRLKNLVQRHDPASTIFPTLTSSLSQKSIGVGARFTTLHWPAVDWTMSALGLSLTANQNSIPRELVYDVNAMLEGRLSTVPFPFIGGNVPEGHQGQSVEGMSHGCVLTKLKHGFHRHRIAWGFNADHQPIGGPFDEREDQLVAGCVLASYITFDLSPELATGELTDTEKLPDGIASRVRERVACACVHADEKEIVSLLRTVWRPMMKLKQRDEKYRAAREKLFSENVGRVYARELSIDELPGITTPETTAVMLALAEALEVKIHFIAPAFGFQKNTPYADEAQLRDLIERQWRVCRAFDVSIGFHSGSGKSAENYRLMGEVTGQRLEIKTSGRYTYEMGRALAASTHADDQALWRDWYAFTRELALQGAFAENVTQKTMARSFIAASLGAELSALEDSVFVSPETCRAALDKLEPSPEWMFWFEYNFLYVLAADGATEREALGDHGPAGYRQRARFYAISAEARLRYWKNVAEYLIFLAESIGFVGADRASAARQKLSSYRTAEEMLAAI